MTTYLSTDRLLEKEHPELVQRLVTAAREADKEQCWGILHPLPSSSSAVKESGGEGGDREGAPAEYLNVRVMELHEVDAGGALSNHEHFDGGSLVTLDVMMSRPGEDFEGGAFCTPGENEICRHEFNQGDLVVFPSHKRHFVEPVRGGHRRVMVVELWRGKARGCAHRCLDHLGTCEYSANRSRADALLQASFPEVDPW